MDRLASAEALTMCMAVWLDAHAIAATPLTATITPEPARASLLLAEIAFSALGRLAAMYSGCSATSWSDRLLSYGS